VLGNLTINACQAMTAPILYEKQTSTTLENYGKLTISACEVVPDSARGEVVPVSARGPQKKMVAIAVKDMGTGITAENMKKLFEPLFTTKAKGIGLGLAVSKKLAEANGGRIEVESEVGKGSTFTLILPVMCSDLDG